LLDMSALEREHFLGFWEVDLAKQPANNCPEVVALLGYEVSEYADGWTFLKLVVDSTDMFKLKRSIILASKTLPAKPFKQNIALKHKDGSLIYLSIIGRVRTSQTGRISIDGTFENITAYKSEKESSRLANQQLASFIEQLPAAIAIIDEKQNYIAASNVWKDHFNLERTDIAGISHYTLFPVTPKIWKQYHRRAMEGENLSMEEDSFLDQYGNTEWMEWQIKPWYQFSGTIGGIILSGSKISERHAFIDTIMKAMITAEESTRVKSDFLSVMSHEIRTPLNAILGFINLLLLDPRPDQIEKMSILKFSAKNLLAIINNILDYNKLEVGKITLDIIDFSLKQLLVSIQSSMQPEAESRNIELLLIIDPLIPDYIHADPVRLGQILNNLISNALKFTNAGSVSVRLALNDADDKQVKVEFKIQDTGIGIAPDQQKAVFEMFTQADASTTRKYGGSGLGLSISQELAAMMGGKIVLTSTPGEGSEFSFILNLEKCLALKPGQSTPDPVQLNLNGLRVLIVEDQQINTIVLKNFLGQWNCICSIAENGRIATEMVGSNDYDLVLMDLQMPEMDGYQAARTIRQFSGDKYCRLPIIALTASAVPSIKDEILNAGMNGVLGKPFEPQELYDLISELTRK
jgi:PAS domain S-box-containing protein